MIWEIQSGLCMVISVAREVVRCCIGRPLFQFQVLIQHTPGGRRGSYRTCVGGSLCFSFKASWCRQASSYTWGHETKHGIRGHWRVRDCYIMCYVSSYEPMVAKLDLSKGPLHGNCVRNCTNPPFLQKTIASIWTHQFGGSRLHVCDIECTFE